MADGHQVDARRQELVQRRHLFGPWPVEGVDDRRPFEQRTKGRPEGPGVVVDQIELVPTQIARDDVAGLVPGVADLLRRWSIEDRLQPSERHRSAAGEQRDVVSGCDEPVRLGFRTSRTAFGGIYGPGL